MANGQFIAYYRVSTQKQGRSGLGLEAQQAAVRNYLNGGEWSLLGEFVEIESGKDDDRPQLQEALKLARLTNSVLIVAKLDRLSRNLHFLTSLQRAGVRFICADNPSANELTINLLSVLAQHERQMISERTKAALAAAKVRGQVLGNPFLDQCRNTDLSRANIERSKQSQAFAHDLVGIIHSIKAGGISSLSGVARELNRRGITTRRGNQWNPAGVSRILSMI